MRRICSITILAVIAAALTVLFAGNVVAAPMGTALTYQGQLIYPGHRLRPYGSQINGVFDFQFSLWDASNTPPGSLIGTTQTVSTVSVSNGLFTVALDFGAGAFNGEARWLEIWVRTNSSGMFTELVPRQLVPLAPYALYAAEAGNMAATNLIGIVSDAQLSSNVARLNGSANFIGAVTAVSFAGNGSGLTNLNAMNLTGTLSLSNLNPAVLTNHYGAGQGIYLSTNRAATYIDAYGTSRTFVDSPGAIGIGAGALRNATTNLYNAVGIGSFAMPSLTNGDADTAVGAWSCESLLAGTSITALGHYSFYNLVSGTNLTAIGQGAGQNLTNGQWDIYIGNSGVANETGVIRIGDTNETDAYIAGIIHGDGSGLTNLNAMNLTGTLPLSNLNPAVVTNGIENFSATTITASNFVGALIIVTNYLAVSNFVGIASNLVLVGTTLNNGIISNGIITSVAITNADGAGITNIPAGNITGTLPLSNLTPALTNLAGGNGSALTNIPPSGISGTAVTSAQLQSATDNVLMNVSSNFVPYMGAISNVNLGNHSMSLSLITSGNGDEISGFKVSAQTLTNDLVDGFSYSANSLSSGGEQHGLFVNSDSPITLDGFYGVYIDGSQISINPDGYKYGVFVTGAGSHFGDIDTEGSFIGNETGDLTKDFIFGASQKDHTLFENQANRMFFDKTKAAFRAGHDLSGYWDSDKVGNYSWAGGVDSEASGWYSFALGRDSYAWGNYSFAFGNGVNALGQGSIAMGLNASSDAASFMAGTGIAGIGHGQIAMGYVSAYGKSIRAEGNGSIAMGQDVNALTNDNVLVFGRGFSTSTQDSFNIGFGQLDYQFTSNNADFKDSSITTTGTNTASYFIGNGAGLINLPVSAITNFVGSVSNTVQSATNNFVGTVSNMVQSATNNVLVVATNSFALVQTNILFVEVNGNDATGQRNDKTKPFATIGAAVTNSVAGDVIQLGAGYFSCANLPTMQPFTTIRGYPHRTFVGTAPWGGRIYMDHSCTLSSFDCTNGILIAGVNKNNNTAVSNIFIENLYINTPLASDIIVSPWGGLENGRIKNCYLASGYDVALSLKNFAIEDSTFQVINTFGNFETHCIQGDDLTLKNVTMISIAGSPGYCIKKEPLFGADSTLTLDNCILSYAGTNSVGIVSNDGFGHTFTSVIGTYRDNGTNVCLQPLVANSFIGNGGGLTNLPVSGISNFTGSVSNVVQSATNNFGNTVAVSLTNAANQFTGAFTGNASGLTNYGVLSPGVMYVDTNSPGDAYGVIGDKMHPFKTIAYAWTNCPTGGTIWLTPGQRFTVTISGSPPYKLKSKGSLSIIGNGSTIFISTPKYFILGGTNNFSATDVFFDTGTNSSNGPFTLDTNDVATSQSSFTRCTFNGSADIFYGDDGVFNSVVSNGFVLQLVDCSLSTTWDSFAHFTGTGYNPANGPAFLLERCKWYSVPGGSGPNTGAWPGGYYVRYKDCEFTTATNANTYGLNFDSTALPLVADVIGGHFISTNSYTYTPHGGAIRVRSGATVNIYGNPCEYTNVVVDTGGQVNWNPLSEFVGTFIGNGSGLTNLPVSAITNFVSSVSNTVQSATNNVLTTASNSFVSLSSPVLTNQGSGYALGSVSVTNLTNSSLTANMIPYAGTGGQMLGSTKLQFDGTELGVGTAPVAGILLKGSISTSSGTNYGAYIIASGNPVSQTNTITGGYFGVTNGGYWTAHGYGLNVEGTQLTGTGDLTFTLLNLIGHSCCNFPMNGISMVFDGNGTIYPMNIFVTGSGSGSPVNLYYNTFSNAAFGGIGAVINNSLYNISEPVSTLKGSTTTITNGGDSSASSLYGSEVIINENSSGIYGTDISYGFKGTINSGNSAADNAYVFNGSYKYDNVADEFYGMYLKNTTTATINDPTVNQIGIWVNNDSKGTDANNKRWAFYNAGTNVVASKVLLVNTNVPVFIGTTFSMVNTNGQLQLNGNVSISGTNTANYYVGNGLGLTNLTATNTVYTMNTFASASNTLTLNNSYWLLQTSGNGAITNVNGQIAGQPMWSTLWVSNSSGSAITFSYTAAGRAIGSATTNQLSIAAGKMGVVSVFGFGSAFTNYCDTAQQ